MPEINVNDFWTQALAALAVAIVMLWVQRDWVRKPGNPASGVNNGNQVNLPPGAASGPVHINQAQHKTSITLVENRIEASNAGKAQDDDVAKVVGIVIAGVVAAGLFLFVRFAVQWVAFGMTLACLLLLVVAVVRTSKLHLWTARAMVTAAIACGGAFVTVFTWDKINTLRRDSLSLDLIREGAPNYQGAAEPSAVIDYFLNSLLPVLFAGDFEVLMFVLCLLIAAVCTVILCVYCWILLLNWHAYLGFTTDQTHKPKLAVRAKSFLEMKVFGSLLGAAIIGGIAILGASGAVFDLWQGSL